MAAATLRPQTLEEFVGQDKLKAKARVAIGAALARDEPLPHVLLAAPGGLGKTSFCQVLANELYAPFVATSGQALSSPLELRNLLVRLRPKTVLLCDEAHLLRKPVAEELLICLEEGVLNVTLNGRDGPVRIPVPPFTFVAATTEQEALSAPLRQRFGLTFLFDFYSVGELCQFVSGVFAKWELAVELVVLDGIARRARGVPRLALRLSERVRDVVQARSESIATTDSLRLAMDIEGIDRLGLTVLERRLLRALAAAEPRPLSARNLALVLGVEMETITGVLEPGLVRLGMMTIGAGGRRITPVGREHLQAGGETV